MEAAAASLRGRNEPTVVGELSTTASPTGLRSRPAGGKWEEFNGLDSRRLRGNIMNSRSVLAAAAALLCVSLSPSGRAENLLYEWYTVANNGDLIPGSDKSFNSYNQPAVNQDGTVVFRARSRGGSGPGAGQPEHGIYVRHLGNYDDIAMVFRRGGEVPQPNNSAYGPGGDPARFNEFPSVPRIDASSETIATRAQSEPVWEYLQDGVEARTGTAGVYTNALGRARTAASMVGDVPGFEYFQVPVAEAPPGTGFDQFPGSPAVTKGSLIVFKGNFAVNGVGKTGIFYRNATRTRGQAPIELVASSYTDIPGSNVKFGSTAPPGAGGGYVVFAGYDDEAAPTLGGIYRARITSTPVTLETVVAIGDPVPDGGGAFFKAFGEAVSVSSDGRHVLFWGSWGDELRRVRVRCADEGNAARRAYCLEVTGDGLEKFVPLHQGFFVKDMRGGTTAMVAQSGDGIVDFVYWNFSGRVPGMPGEGDDIEEPARWRTATYGALSGNGARVDCALKARGVDGADALYLRGQPAVAGPLVTLLRTGDPAAMVDPEAPPGAVVSAIGIERDGFRDHWLAITLGMLAAEDVATAVAGEEPAEDTGWAGVYAVRFLDDEVVP